MSSQVDVAPNVNINVSVEKKRPRLLSILFADFTNVTSDNKPNVLGIFDRIFIDPEEPTTPPFVLFVRVAEVTESFDVVMFDADEKPTIGIKSVPTSASYTEGLPRQVQTAIVFRFPVKKEGTYWFDVSYKGESLGGAGLVIQYRKTEGRQSGTDTFV